MDGRINRDSLNPGPRRTVQQAEAPNVYTPKRVYRSNYGSRNVSRRRGLTQKDTIIPQGRDLMVVQLFASGVLLFLVMFVALFPSEFTEKTRGLLKYAFSKNTSFEEASESFNSIKNRITGLDNTVKEVLGNEGEGTAEDMSTAEPPDNTDYEITVDSALLNELNQQADTSKNQ